MIYQGDEVSGGWQLALQAAMNYFGTNSEHYAAASIGARSSTKGVEKFAEATLEADMGSEAVTVGR